MGQRGEVRTMSFHSRSISIFCPICGFKRDTAINELKSGFTYKCANCENIIELSNQHIITELEKIKKEIDTDFKHMIDSLK